MKRCPTCDKTFDDNMRFCQADGTPLVDEAPIDPYKTMVATPADIAAATTSSSPESEDVLDLPASSDPAKTMYASEEEIRAEMAAHDGIDEQVIDIPPLEPEAPKFSEPTPPPSPFSTPDIGSMTTPPIPSPFEEKPSTYEPPPPPVFAEPEPVREEVAFNPFDQPPGGAMAQSEWTPPPVPDSSWQNQPVGQNTPFQPPPAGAGPNQTLAIVSLIVGILSIFCCGWIIPSIVAIVLGFMAKNKADSDPANFGGRGMALGGIITGAISLVLGLIVVALYFLGFLASVLGNM